MTEENLNNNEIQSTDEVKSTKRAPRRGGYHRNYKNTEKTEEREKAVRTRKSTRTPRASRGLKSEGAKVEKGLIKVEHRSIAKRDEFRFKRPSIKIIPLGGIEEIGKNITVFEYDNDIIVVDCGLEFPTDDMLGIDLVIPDVSYLVKNKEKVKGIYGSECSYT